MRRLPENLSVETLAVQGGYQAKEGEPKQIPLYQATTYHYDNAQSLADLFDLKREGYFYTRLANPTVSALEEKVAQLEGGIGAVATSAGQGASLITILTICRSGDHFIATNNIYGGTYNLFTHTLRAYGIDVSYVSPDASLEEIKAEVKENTKLIWSETIGNPGLEVLDFEKFSKAAHDNNIPLVVDSTFATPYLCKPFEHGADIVIHSTTKYLDGHGLAVGGVIVDSGKFDWTKGNFPSLTEHDVTYHGLSYTETFKEGAFLTKARAVYIRDFGNIMSPFNAFLTHIGIDTLALRMDKHSSNALKLAEFLESHEKIEWVNYPYLESSKDYNLAKKYLKGGSGVISIGVKGGKEKAQKLIEGLNLAAMVIHVGDVKTYVLHPASTTHRQLSDEELKNSKIEPNQIRISVGIENPDEIIADFKNALELI